MIKNIRTKGRLGAAVKITARFDGPVEAYALAWLHLTNNAREWPATFLKVYNDSGDLVTVITTENSADSVKDYLTSLSGIADKIEDGKLVREFSVTIEDTEKIPTVTPMVDWVATYEDDTDDDVEVLPAADLI